MKKMFFIITLLVLTSCSNWNYKDIAYLDEQNAMLVDTFRIKYKTNKKGEVTKVKLVK